MVGEALTAAEIIDCQVSVFAAWSGSHNSQVFEVSNNVQQR